MPIRYSRLKSGRMSALQNPLLARRTLQPTTQRATEEKNVPVSKGKHKKLNKMTFCARISQSNMDKVKILSENKSIPISDIIDFALEDFLNKYEKKNGEITSQAPRGVADLLK